jgi:hypothetical protein
LSVNVTAPTIPPVATIDELRQQVTVAMRRMASQINGATLANDLDINQHRVVNMTAPVSPLDAVNKQYVDKAVSQVKSGAAFFAQTNTILPQAISSATSSSFFSVTSTSFAPVTSYSLVLGTGTWIVFAEADISLALTTAQPSNFVSIQLYTNATAVTQAGPFALSLGQTSVGVSSLENTVSGVWTVVGTSTIQLYAKCSMNVTGNGINPTSVLLAVKLPGT